MEEGVVDMGVTGGEGMATVMAAAGMEAGEEGVGVLGAGEVVVVGGGMEVAAVVAAAAGEVAGAGVVAAAGLVVAGEVVAGGVGGRSSSLPTHVKLAGLDDKRFHCVPNSRSQPRLASLIVIAVHRTCELESDFVHIILFSSLSAF
jgi:hypothetical protein